jgi:cell division septum initiation protein DivIVA
VALLTLDTLRAKNACAGQLAEFRARFGDSVDVTPGLCESVAPVFNWDWAARNLLTASARAEYERVRAAALAEYERVTASAWAEYERVTAPALAEYERVRASAWAEHQRARARAFGEAYCGQEVAS